MSTPHTKHIAIFKGIGTQTELGPYTFVAFLFYCENNQNLFYFQARFSKQWQKCREGMWDHGEISTHNSDQLPR